MVYRRCEPGGRFKNTCELLNLRAFYFHLWIKYTSFNVWVRYFVRNSKGTLWNSTQNIIEMWRALRFKSSYPFLTPPPPPPPPGILLSASLRINAFDTLSFPTVTKSGILYVYSLYAMVKKNEWIKHAIQTIAHSHAMYRTLAIMLQVIGRIDNFTCSKYWKKIYEFFAGLSLFVIVLLQSIYEIHWSAEHIQLLYGNSGEFVAMSRNTM